MGGFFLLCELGLALELGSVGSMDTEEQVSWLLGRIGGWRPWHVGSLALCFGRKESRGRVCAAKRPLEPNQMTDDAGFGLRPVFWPSHFSAAAGMRMAAHAQFRRPTNAGTDQLAHSALVNADLSSSFFLFPISL
jgi:hypothetical protein